MVESESVLENEIARWNDLESTCSAALEVSQIIGRHLSGGSPAHAVVKSLRHEARLAAKLSRGIELIDPSSAIARDRSPRLAERMKSLLDLEHENYRLLSRKGVKLSGSHFTRSPGSRG